MLNFNFKTMKFIRFKYIERIIRITVVIFLLQSCNEKLNLIPEDFISDASFWKTENDFKIAATNFYFTLKGWQSEPDGESDLMTTCQYFNSISDGSYITSEQSSTWDNAYKDIRGFNYLIAKREGYKGNTTDIDRYIGEAKFFRAYVYFNLLKNYGGVPIILEPLDTDSEELYKKRDTREAVVDQIITDLDASIAVLPSESDIVDQDKGRISKQGAQGFKARVALYEGTWQKFRENHERAEILLQYVVNASNNVINSGEFELFKALGDSSYKYLFLIDNNAIAKSNPLGLNKSDNKEYIIMKKYSYELGITNGHSHALYMRIAPTKKMADMYLCSDGLPINKSPLFLGKGTMTSEYKNRDLRLQNSFMIPGKRYYSYGALGRDFDNSDNPGEGMGLHKAVFGANTCTGYSIIKTVTEKKDISSGLEEADYPVLRYSEILLIYAEAKYELDGYISDADLDKSLNIVRDRVNMPHLTNTFISTNGLNMREEIRRERAVELLIEGFRLDDLKRWKTAEIEMPKSLRGIKYTNTEYEENPDFDKLDQFDNEGFYVWQFAENRSFENKHYLFPLPTVQVDMMELQQNPGW